MANPPLQLVIGNYNTSSWSLRASLVLRLARLAFIEIRIPLRRPETAERIARYSPSGKLPVLLAEGVPIWDSLAIAEFTAELEPSIWPIDPVRRAEARSISAEMHSGFADLRRLMPMDIVSRFNPPGKLPRGLARDVERIKTIWRRCRERYAADGPFLFGAFSVADAMFAPVATRFVTHGVPVEGLVEDYVDSVMAWPDMAAWCDAAAGEQEERRRHGSLGVVETARPGRILDGNGENGEAMRREDHPADDWHRQEPAVPPSPEPTMPPAAAATADPERRDAEADRPAIPPPEPVPETGSQTAGQADEAPAAQAASDEADVGEPRSEEPAAEAVLQPVAERHDAIERGPLADDDVRREPAFPPLPPLEAKGRPERAPERKLGWIRRPVPQEHLDEVEEKTKPSHPLRRTGLGIEVPPERTDDDAPRPDKLRPIAREGTLMPAVRPAEQQHRAEGGSGDEKAGSGRQSERQDGPARSPAPPAPAVKPIGGGILRRR